VKDEIKLLKHDFLGKIFTNNYYGCFTVGYYIKNKHSIGYARRLEGGG
jgi:phenolic acid decarboxylase